MPLRNISWRRGLSVFAVTLTALLLSYPQFTPANEPASTPAASSSHPAQLKSHNAAGSKSPLVTCDPSDPAFICGLHSPEDIVRLPGMPWVVASSLNLEFANPPRVRGPGPLSAINVDTHAVRKLFPAPDSAVDWDRATYPDCSAPPRWLMSVGVNARPASGGKVRLYVASHGERESVEIFDVAVRGEGVQATWRGCVPVPKELAIWPNAVVPLVDGGIALAGDNVATWRPGRGWKKIEAFKGMTPGEPPHGEYVSFANGVEVSRDGRWLFVADTYKKTVTRMPIDGDGQSTTITWSGFSPGSFWPDNLRWGEDGGLYLSGPFRTDAELPQDCYKRPICDELGTGIVRIDPETLTATLVYRSEGIKGKFGAATTALQVGDRFWIATSVGDRLAIVSVPH